MVINNVSVANSTGIFNNDSSYDISVNGETVYTMNNLENTNFTYNGYEFKIIIKDTNATSIKQFATSSQDSFLKFYI